MRTLRSRSRESSLHEPESARTNPRMHEPIHEPTNLSMNPRSPERRPRTHDAHPPPESSHEPRPSPGHDPGYTAGPKSIKIHVKTLQIYSAVFSGWPERTLNDGATLSRYNNLHNENHPLTLSEKKAFLPFPRSEALTENL